MQLALKSVPAALEITTGATESEWDRYVASHPSASAYHVWRWRHVFEEAFGHETIYLSAREDGEIVGVLPLVLFRSALFGRFAVSLPFVNYGGVCARDAEVAQALVDGARKIAVENRLKHVELRHTTAQFPDLPARQHKVGMFLALARDAASAWDAIDRKARNHVRKAEKSGLTTRSGGRELLDRFYRVFATNMRDLGTPVYSIRLFDRVLSTFPDTTRVFLVDKDDTTVAGGIAIVHRDTLEVPWASSLRASRPLCPNNLMYWRIIEHAIAAGLRTFDFGRSTPNEGTFHFKQQWGAEPRPLRWEYVLRDGGEMPNLSPSNPRYRKAIDLWTRLPLPITNLIGPHIVRSIP
jgi:FemAB-related protein (PEP-CTERM system-associated)